MNEMKPTPLLQERSQTVHECYYFNTYRENEIKQTMACNFESTIVVQQLHFELCKRLLL